MIRTYRGKVVTLAGAGAPDRRELTVESGILAESDGDQSAPAVDFGDRVIMPGFVDAHTHAEVAALALATMADCRAPGVTSIGDVLDVLRQHLRRVPENGWLIGQGNLFLDQKLAERRLPTRDELDTVSSVVPIAIRAGGHVSAVNSRALQLIGFEFDDPQESFMGPATVVRDADGRATGVVSELDSQFPVELPEPGELRRIMADGIDELYTRRGVTTIGEITETLEGAQAIVDAVVAGEVSSRVRLYFWAPGTLPLEAALDWRSHLRVPDGNERIRVDGVKLFTDGGFSGRTAAMLTPYVDEWALTPGSTGELAMTEAQLKNWLQRILDAGLDPIVHTCGERAQRVLVEVLLEMGLGESSGVRIRSEHSPNFISEFETIDYWVRGGLVPVTNPGFIQAIGLSLPQYIGAPAERGRFPYRSILDRGLRIGAGSDMHMGGDPRQTNPFFGIWCAVTRTGFGGELVEPDEAISVEEGMLMHTLYAAESMGVADRVGSLEAGKSADFIVLDRDPRAVPPDELLEIQVDFVYVGGKLVYERPGAEPAVTAA